MSSNSGGISIAGTAPEMQRHKIQKGRLFRKHGSWHVEYYQEVPARERGAQLAADVIRNRAA